MHDQILHALQCLLCSCRKPVLVIHHQRADGPTIAFRLIPCIASGTFPLAKLAPSRNNLRPAEGGSESMAKLLATPDYNKEILWVCPQVTYPDNAKRSCMYSSWGSLLYLVHAWHVSHTRGIRKGMLDDSIPNLAGDLSKFVIGD